jgi:hypothetical protein
MIHMHNAEPPVAINLRHSPDDTDSGVKKIAKLLLMIVWISFIMHWTDLLAWYLRGCPPNFLGVYHLFYDFGGVGRGIGGVCTDNVLLVRSFGLLFWGCCGIACIDDTSICYKLRDVCRCAYFSFRIIRTLLPLGIEMSIARTRRPQDRDVHDRGWIVDVRRDRLHRRLRGWWVDLERPPVPQPRLRVRPL